MGCSLFHSRVNISVKKKLTLHNALVLDAQFGLILYWAFIAQRSRKSPFFEALPEPTFVTFTQHFPWIPVQLP